MSGVERDQIRIKDLQEVFTPTWMVQELLDKLDQSLFSNVDQEFIDPTCGDGQFLGEVLIRKLEAGVAFAAALETIFGVDLMKDNVELCRERLLCGQEHLRYIVEKNIVQGNALNCSYTFGEPETFGPSGIFEIE